jgi:drug/metabolite transporter (DMT)-like permease
LVWSPTTAHSSGAPHRWSLPSPPPASSCRSPWASSAASAPRWAPPSAPPCCSPASRFWPRARGTGARADRTAILLAVLAAASFGSYFVVLDAAAGASGDPLWIAGLVAVGSASAAVPALLKLGGVAALAPPAKGRAGVVAVGLLLALADVALTAAMARGDVALVAVISSSDPAITVVAARIVLAERVSRAQGAGVALALTGLLAVAAA